MQITEPMFIKFRLFIFLTLNHPQKQIKRKKYNHQTLTSIENDFYKEIFLHWIFTKKYFVAQTKSQTIQIS